jgi:hypothetical protein
VILKLHTLCLYAILYVLRIVNWRYTSWEDLHKEIRDEMQSL